MAMKSIDPVSSDIRNTELGTWAGRSKFWYEGSVEQGIIIHFGNDRSRRMRAGLFANMVERFAGCTVRWEPLAQIHPETVWEAG